MMDADHFRNWIAAVRSRKPGDLTAEIEEGHLSSTLAHLANIAYRTGRTLQFDPQDRAIRRRRRGQQAAHPAVPGAVRGARAGLGMGAEGDHRFLTRHTADTATGRSPGSDDLLIATTSMHGNVFALATIAMTCVTLAILKIFGQRPDRRAVLAGALLMVVTFFVLAFVAFGHACSRGGPFGVVVFGAVFAGTLRATIEKKVVTSLGVDVLVRAHVLGHEPLPPGRIHR